MAVSATGALSNVVKQEIPKGIREMRTKIDPVWQEIFVSSRGVHREGLGRDWKFLKTLVNGLSGGYEFKANSVLVGSNFPVGPSGDVDIPDAAIIGAPTGFPGRTETTAPAFHQTEVLLKEARGNFFIPVKWMQLDEFDSSIGSAVKELLSGAAMKCAWSHALAFYTTDATSFKLVDNIDGSPSNATFTPAASGAATVVVTLNNSDSTQPSGRINMMFPGMLVDVYLSDNVKKNTNPWIITKVDYLGNKYTMTETVAADTDIDFTVAGTFYITLRNSRGNQPSGLESWIKNSGTITTLNLNLANFPLWGSLIPAAINGPLTEKILNKYVGTFEERLGTVLQLDTGVSSAGVVHSYLENEDNLARYERNGRRLNIAAGWTDIDYAYHGMPFRWAISSFCAPKTLYVLKLKDQNIKEYVPPKTPGGGRNSEFENEIQFVAQLGGSTKIFLHEQIVSGATSSVGDNLQAPFFRICEVAPEKPQSIKLSGLDESIA